VSVLLAIETSCDETAAAVVAEDGAILANVVSTQVAIHAPYGGVVPELASRHHIENIIPVVRGAMAEAELDFPALDAIAVTQGPGLIGSLLVGLQVAKSIAFVHGKPLVPVHHIAGHLQAPFLAHPEIPLPALALVVSGGHTSLFDMPAPGAYRLLGRTRDDAAGEAFDKVAKLLGLGYPGGPIIDRLSRGANDRAVEFALARIKDGKPDFSFSGLKTAVLLHVRRHGVLPVPEGEDAPPVVRDLVASFQRAVVSALLRGLERGAIAHRPKSLLLTGGVAANLLLRTEAERLAARLGLPLYMPPIELSTDNAAMIGAAGFLALRRGDRLGWDANAAAQMPLA
jgi:N6-L-threonylcarbamoyladenine synthase